MDSLREPGREASAPEVGEGRGPCGVTMSIWGWVRVVGTAWSL